MVLEMEMSKTYQYRKVMKPMLERKRRARINKCLDELKDIMVECLTQEGEHITRLEKADILELTVEHMKKLRAQKQLRINQQQKNSVVDKTSVAESFRAGYIHAANEVSKTLASVGVSVDLGTQLMSHLGHRLNYLQVVVPTASVISQSTSSPATTTSSTSLPSPTPSSICSISPNSNYNHQNSGYYSHHSASSSFLSQQQQQQAQSNHMPVIITPPPSECSDRSLSPLQSDSNCVWRPW